MKRGHARELRRSLVDVRALVRSLGLDAGAKTQPRGMVIRCPWHGERNASCSVRVATDGTIAVKCQACGQTGDALSLVAICYDLDVRRDFRDVLRVGAELAGRWDILDALDGKVERRPAPPRPPPAPPPSLAIETFDAIAVRLAHLAPVDASRDVASYLEGRRVYADAQAVGVFALPASLREQRSIVAKLRAEFGEDLALAGLVRGEGFAWSEHRVCLPWRTRAGLVSTLQRRCLDGRKDKYMFASGRSALDPFGAEFFDDATDCTEVVFSESALDSLARRKLARDAGERVYVLGLPSAATWRDPWTAYARGRDVVLSLDGDDAGDKGAAKIHEAIFDVARSVTRERPHGAKDASELLQGAA